MGWGDSIPIVEGEIGPPRSGFVLRLCIRKADGAWGEAARDDGLADTRFCRRRTTWAGGRPDGRSCWSFLFVNAMPRPRFSSGPQGRIRSQQLASLTHHQAGGRPASLPGRRRVRRAWTTGRRIGWPLALESSPDRRTISTRRRRPQCRRRDAPTSSSCSSRRGPKEADGANGGATHRQLGGIDQPGGRILARASARSFRCVSAFSRR